MIPFRATMPDGTIIEPTVILRSNGAEILNHQLRTVRMLFKWFQQQGRWPSALELCFGDKQYTLTPPTWKTKPNPVKPGHENVLFFAYLSHDEKRPFAGLDVDHLDRDLKAVVQTTMDPSRGDSIPGVFIRQLHYKVGNHWNTLFDSDDLKNPREDLRHSLFDELRLQANYMEIPDEEQILRIIHAADGGGNVRMSQREFDRALRTLDDYNIGAEDSLD